MDSKLGKILISGEVGDRSKTYWLRQEVDGGEQWFAFHEALTSEILPELKAIATTYKDSLEQTIRSTEILRREKAGLLDQVQLLKKREGYLEALLRRAEHELSQSNGLFACDKMPTAVMGNVKMFELSNGPLLADIRTALTPTPIRAQQSDPDGSKGYEGHSAYGMAAESVERVKTPESFGWILKSQGWTKGEMTAVRIEQIRNYESDQSIMETDMEEHPLPSVFANVDATDRAKKIGAALFENARDFGAEMLEIVKFMELFGLLWKGGLRNGVGFVAAFKEHLNGMSKRWEEKKQLCDAMHRQNQILTAKNGKLMAGLERLEKRIAELPDLRPELEAKTMHLRDLRALVVIPMSQELRAAQAQSQSKRWQEYFATPRTVVKAGPRSESGKDDPKNG